MRGHQRCRHEPAWFCPPGQRRFGKEAVRLIREADGPQAARGRGVLGPSGCWDTAAWPDLLGRFFTCTCSMVKLRSLWEVSRGLQRGVEATGVQGYFTNDTSEAFTGLLGHQLVPLYANPWPGFPLASLPPHIRSLAGRGALPAHHGPSLRPGALL